MEKKFISNSLAGTEAIAAEVLAQLNAGDTLILNGDLGAGKTTFTKALAKILGVKENVTSPTFTIVNEYYSGTMPLYHFDMYRIEDEDEAIEIGASDYFLGRGKQKGLCVVEWAQKTPHIVPKNAKRIDIIKTGENSREIIYKD